MLIPRKEEVKTLLEIQRNYIFTIGKSIAGIKALILDSDTTNLIASVVSQSDAHELGFFLVENIETKIAEELGFVSAVYIIKCTSQNMALIFAELSEPHFKDYHFFFVSDVEGPIVRKMAELDKEARISNLSRIYINFVVHTPTTFTPLEVISTARSEMTEDEEALLSACCALRKNPCIRFAKDSSSCSYLADKLHKRFKELAPLLSDKTDAESCTLLLIDRKEDLLTPLLVAWNYIGLLHEFFDFKSNKICVGTNEYNLSLSDDEFYSANIFSNYGDLALNLRKNFEALTDKKQRTTKVDSLEEMQKFIGAVPELKKESSSMAKHFSLVNEITKQVNTRKLMRQAQLEQEMVSKENAQEFYKEILTVFGESGPTLDDKFRLLALFFMRFSASEGALFDALYNLFFGLPESKSFLPMVAAIKSIASQQEKIKQLLAPLGDKAVQLYKEIFSVV